MGTKVVELSVLVRQEDGVWCAQCLEHDIAAQGDSWDQLFRRLSLTVAGQIIVDLKHGKNPLADIEPAPEDLHEEFPKGRRLEVEDPCLPEISPPGVEMPDIRNHIRVLA